MSSNDDGYFDDDYDDEAPVSMTEVRRRAARHFGGYTEEAREAAEQFPGDFI